MKPSSDYLAEGIKELELYPKITSMLDYIILNFETEFQDIKYKYTDPSVVSNDVIKQIIDELGFKYIADIMDTITNYQFNTMLDFLGLINLLKGSRLGMELILKLLGFDSIIAEWWEVEPKSIPDTYDITVILNNSTVLDPFATLNKVKIFARHYVYPIINNVDFRFSFALAEKNITFAGFFRPSYSGSIHFRI